MREIVFFRCYCFYLYEKIIKKNFQMIIISVLLFVLAFIGNFKIYVFLSSYSYVFFRIESLIKKEKFKQYSNKLGNMTYSLYLVHVPTQLTLIFILDKFNLTTNVFQTNYFFIFYFALLFIISHYIFVFFRKTIE